MAIGHWLLPMCIDYWLSAISYGYWPLIFTLKKCGYGITHFGYCPLSMAMLITQWLLAIMHELLVLAIDINTRAILGMVITDCPLSMVML
jgi:hypothetical protein